MKMLSSSLFFLSPHSLPRSPDSSLSFLSLCSRRADVGLHDSAPSEQQQERECVTKAENNPFRSSTLAMEELLLNNGLKRVEVSPLEESCYPP